MIPAAIIFSTFTFIVIVFQGCLAAGVPWGAASMGGKYPGKYPPKMRIIALVNMLILSIMALIVLSRAGIILPQLRTISQIGVWVIVVFLFFGTIMNILTPSKIERIWAPVAFIQFLTSLWIALN